VAVATFFACGLMSKPMLVTLPFVLLLLDYWPLARHQRSEVRGPAFAKATARQAEVRSQISAENQPDMIPQLGGTGS